MIVAGPRPRAADPRVCRGLQRLCVDLAQGELVDPGEVVSAANRELMHGVGARHIEPLVELSLAPTGHHARDADPPTCTKSACPATTGTPDRRALSSRGHQLAAGPEDFHEGRHRGAVHRTRPYAASASTMPGGKQRADTWRLVGHDETRPRHGGLASSHPVMCRLSMSLRSSAGADCRLVRIDILCGIDTVIVGGSSMLSGTGPSSAEGAAAVPPCASVSPCSVLEAPFQCSDFPAPHRECCFPRRHDLRSCRWYHPPPWWNLLRCWRCDAGIGRAVIVRQRTGGGQCHQAANVRRSTATMRILLNSLSLHIQVAWVWQNALA